MGGKVGEIAGDVDGPTAERTQRFEERGHALVLVDTRDRDIETVTGERLGDGPADAAPATGDQGDGTVCHAANLVEVRWSATRSACAAMVSAGLTAAELGRKAASTTNRFEWSWARQNGSSADVAGSVPNRTVPHWCDGVRRSKGRASTIG